MFQWKPKVLNNDAGAQVFLLDHDSYTSKFSQGYENSELLDNDLSRIRYVIDDENDNSEVSPARMKLFGQVERIDSLGLSEVEEEASPSNKGIFKSKTLKKMVSAK